jgi:hypothetical protein
MQDYGWKPRMVPALFDFATRQPLMTIPAQADTTRETGTQESLRLLNRAYGCYAFIGLTFLVFLAIVSAIPQGEAAEGYGMMMGLSLGVPLVLGSTIAFVAGIVLTLRLQDRWRLHRPLVVVCLTHILFLAGAIGVSSAIPDEPGKPLEYALYAMVGIYIAIAVLVPGWWFAIVDASIGNATGKMKAQIRCAGVTVCS